MSELSSLEPDVRGPSLAWLLPHEGHLHTVQAMHALHASAGNTVAWHWASPVSALSANTIQTEDQSHRFDRVFDVRGTGRSEEHTSELQSLMRISYAVFCLKKK